MCRENFSLNWCAVAPKQLDNTGIYENFNANTREQHDERQVRIEDKRESHCVLHCDTKSYYKL